MKCCFLIEEVLVAIFCDLKSLSVYCAGLQTNNRNVPSLIPLLEDRGHMRNSMAYPSYPLGDNRSDGAAAGKDDYLLLF